MKLHYDELTQSARSVFDSIKTLHGALYEKLESMGKRIYTLPEPRRTTIGKIGQRDVWWIPGWGVELVPIGTSYNGSLFWLVYTLEEKICADHLSFVPRNVDDIVSDLLTGKKL